MSEKVVGLTKSFGFQFTITKTLLVSPETVWDFLLSELGVSIWLGKINFEDFELNTPFTTAEGIEGKITIFRVDSHIRLAWKPRHWSNNSAIEIRVFNVKGRAKIGFHHTRMIDVTQREEVKVYWTKIMQEIALTLAIH
jgi:activator of HSP90 ATPase